MMLNLEQSLLEYPPEKSVIFRCSEMIRKTAGWLMGAWYVVLGDRTRAIRSYDREGTVLSLVSHNPQKDVFEKLIGFLLRNGFHFISSDSLLDDDLVALGKEKGRLAWLSLDDGWLDTVENVLPIIEKHEIPLTYFISPGETFVGDLWPHRVVGKISKAQREALWHLGARERYETIRYLVGDVKKRSLMDEGDIRRLSAHPLIRFENHTYSHLSCYDRPVSDVVDEVRHAQKILSEWTGREPRMMCYPFGRYTRETDARIRSEFGLVPVKLQPGVMQLENLCEIRNQFYDNMTLLENSCRVFGAWRKIRSFTASSKG